MPFACPNLSRSGAPGRWVRLGPYYAMFPVEHVVGTIRRFAVDGYAVVDPFCGRGTVPFVAMAMGLPAIAADISPVAWLYTKAKTSPHPKLNQVLRRIAEIRDCATSDDRRPEDEFQEMAYCQDVLAFINAARRHLEWRRDRLDRTVAALLAQHLHGKRGNSLSNQLRPSRAMSPGYCVKWWRKNSLESPPMINPSDYLQSRARWRYAKGIPRHLTAQRPRVALGNAASVLPRHHAAAALVLTSPPYQGVINYRADSWLRLWALGEGPCRPDWRTDQKFESRTEYEATLRSCFAATLDRTTTNATWCVRTDARKRTREVVTSVLGNLLPDHRLHQFEAPFMKPTQTALYGDNTSKPGEVDLIYVSPQRSRRYLMV